MNERVISALDLYNVELDLLPLSFGHFLSLSFPSFGETRFFVLEQLSVLPQVLKLPLMCAILCILIRLFV